MWYDADIDAVMARTAMRPIPSGRVSRSEALVFGLILGICAILALGTLLNMAAAALLAFTIFFYVVFLLRRRLHDVVKRRTPEKYRHRRCGWRTPKIRGADTLVTRAPRVVGQFEATVGVPGAFGVSSGHSPFAILSLPACVSRSPPDNSCMYPSLISRSLCSAEIARCIKPLAQSRNETNSSWVNGGAGAIPRISAGFPSGRLTSSNVAT